MRRGVGVVFLGVCAAIGVTDARADGPVLKGPLPSAARLVEPKDEGDDEKKVRAVVPSAAMRGALKADTRVPALAKEVADAMKIADKAARKARLQQLAPQILAVRGDALKKSGVDGLALGKRIEGVPTMIPLAAKPAKPPAPPPSDGLLSTVNVTSFPKNYTFKDECPDQGDKWDFDGAKIKLFATSTPMDADCDIIRAGKSATVAVPAGARRMVVEVSASVELDASAAAFGAYASAKAFFGVRAVAPGGNLLMPIGKVPAPVQLVFLKKATAKNFVPNPIPFDVGAYTDEFQPGDEGEALTFLLPQANMPATSFEIGMFTSLVIDADLSGVATASSELKPKSMKVTFYSK